MLSNQIRPPTSELLELHVFYVPEEVWNFKLNTVPVDVISKFFSAGFIRVSPHMTLRTLREQLGDYLGEDAVVDQYIFLKCIGKKLAVVKAKQETELKLKSFAPPYAFHPELYLLPGVESIYSSSSSTPERYKNTEYIHAYTSYLRPPSLSDPDHEVGQNPKILESSSKNQLGQTQDKSNLIGWNKTKMGSVPCLPVTRSSKQEKNERIQEKYNSQRREGGISCNTDQRESITSPYILQDFISARQNSVKKSTSVKMPKRKPLSQAQERHHTPRKSKKCDESVASSHVNQDCKQEENKPIQVNRIPQKTKEEASIKLDANTENEGNVASIGMGRHTTGDSGIPESLEERDMDYLHSKRSQQHPGIAKSIADTGSVQDSQTDENNLNDFAHPSQYLSPPTPPLLALSVNRAEVPNRIFPTEGSELVRQLQHIKTERKHLEKTREELVKKVKGLLEQNKLRRYHARDSWKKKYFEAKKVTASLEEVLNKLQEDLELHYQKLLMQLEARDIRKKRNNSTHIANSRNNTIVQITTLQHEIDQLRRKLDNVKMKLVIEIKMRKQAASDLRALKAELAHKKVQSSFKLQSEKEVF
ncbi:spermatogenesis-associated protein 1 isoform X2 [Rhineura floridana]|uniref:spermatogenesis-associated protein 1 isoform X2 n=1 Tax=Rhineura floridana TaxID=261503 RepID=UPI002AC81645|nr:spermatogenesis-associated protein 1 isoform X2 [Rhineura floridana]